GAVGVTVVELLGDGQPEHRVAEEHQALVGGQPAVLGGVDAVRQRDGEQVVGQVDTECLEQGCPVVAHSSSRSNMPASLAHRGSICSWWWPGSAVASGTPHCGHRPAQSGPHSGENGSASPTASTIGCSRATVLATTRPTSSDSVVSSVALFG